MFVITIDNVQACLKRHPKPKFQQLRFLHLPAELIHRVMQYMSRRECRKLSRCSRMLREASLLHVYDVRFLLEIKWAKLTRRCKTGLAFRAQDAKTPSGTFTTFSDGRRED